MNARRPSAETITVLETVVLLSEQFRSVAEAVADGSYTLWLGSGISYGRVASLKGIVLRVLTYLQNHSAAEETSRDFTSALIEAIELAELSTEQRAQIDLGCPVSTWADLDLILSRLVSRYSLLLDIRVPHHAPDLLLWEGVDVRETFASDSLEPDAEHLALAAMMIEGVLPRIISANWDPLLEIAVQRLTGSTSGTLSVCVVPGDIQKPQLQSRLYKFHGCAALAKESPTVYRDYLVGAQSQITGWPHDPNHAAMRHQMISLAVSTPTLMIGLSAQDTDIQDLFVGAKSIMTWAWPSEPPAYAFAEDRLSTMQRNLLKAVYSSNYEEHAHEIEGRALVPAYAKQLLIALLLTTLAAKALALAVKVTSADSSSAALLASGLNTYRDRVAAAAGRGDLQFLRTFLTHWTRAINSFRRARPPSTSDLYEELTGAPQWRIDADHHLEVCLFWCLTIQSSRWMTSIYPNLRRFFGRCRRSTGGRL
jgi:hypothetical protein